jgi:hypothetical protein
MAINNAGGNITMMFSQEKEETRRWHRSVSRIGDRARQDIVRKELETLYPEVRYQFNIDVTGASDRSDVRVHIWSTRIDLMGSAIPEDFGGDTCAAILQTVMDLVEDLPDRAAPRL